MADPSVPTSSETETRSPSAVPKPTRVIQLADRKGTSLIICPKPPRVMANVLDKEESIVQSSGITNSSSSPVLTRKCSFDDNHQETTLLRASSSSADLRPAFASQRHRYSHRLLKPDESTPIVRRPSQRCLQMLKRMNSAPDLFNKKGQTKEGASQRRRRAKNNIEKSKSYTCSETARREKRKTRRRSLQSSHQSREGVTDAEVPAPQSRWSSSCQNLYLTAPASLSERIVFQDGDTSKIPTGGATMSLMTRSLTTPTDTVEVPATGVEGQSRTAGSSRDNNVPPPQQSNRWASSDGVQSELVLRRLKNDRSPRPFPRPSSPAADGDYSAGFQRNPTAVTSNRSFTRKLGDERQHDNEDCFGLEQQRTTTINDRSSFSRRQDEHSNPLHLLNEACLGFGRQHNVITSNRSLTSKTSRDYFVHMPERTPDNLANNHSNSTLLGELDDQVVEPENDLFVPPRCHSKQRVPRARRYRRRESSDSQTSLGSVGSSGSYYSTGGLSAVAKSDIRHDSLGVRQALSRSRSYFDTAHLPPDQHGNVLVMHDAQRKSHVSRIVFGRHSYSFQANHAQLHGSNRRQPERPTFTREKSRDLSPRVIARTTSPPTISCPDYENGKDSVGAGSFICDVDNSFAGLELDDGEDELAVFTRGGSSSSNNSTNGSLRSESLNSSSWQSASKRSYHSRTSQDSCKRNRIPGCQMPVHAAWKEGVKATPVNIADLVEKMEVDGEYVIFIGDKKDAAIVRGAQNNDDDSEEGAFSVEQSDRSQNSFLSTEKSS